MGREIETAKRNLSTVKSSEFAAKLANWEPWRLDETSLKKGKNFHVEMMKGHAPEDFKSWVRQLAHRHGVEEREVWAGIAETFRRGQWEVMKHLIERRGSKKRALPFTVVDKDVTSVLTNIEMQLELSREHKNSSGLFDKRQAIKNLGWGALGLIITKLSTGLELMQGSISPGASSANAMALHSDFVRAGIDDYLCYRNLSSDNTTILLSAMARETAAILHPRRND